MSEFIESLLAGDQNAIIKAVLAYFVIVGCYAIFVTFRMSRWPSVIGQLHSIGEKAGVPSWSPDEQNFTGHARYTYTINGINYENDCLSPFYLLASYNLRFLIRWQLRFVERVKPDGVRIYYHSKKPKKSYLIRIGLRSKTLVIAIFVVPIAFLSFFII